ncbi:beta/gamma crystallin-related protein [Methylomagnum ishizawai]|uniref:beta/gamma crystallin-related protein n=1 Tax=Methylomagnum ishizawai TaxID=1760988 RepID=UPI001C33A673|nr:beta/gamma crystallin-related protein [Methylomagnum ishizawai]BBL73748.1 hypothetical protein MishRS11D_08460 [Methylomagnum ishizawai]
MPHIVLFEHENFSGRRVDINQCGSSLGRDHNFNDKTSSIIVVRGTWLVYADGDYNGKCWVLKPGEYPTPGTWGGSHDNISSLRPVPADKGLPLAVLFGDGDFNGRMVSFTEANADFPYIGFNDQVSSAIIVRGNWSAYRDTNFSGQRWALSDKGGPTQNGFYSGPDGFFDNDAISSIRPDSETA